MTYNLFALSLAVASATTFWAGVPAVNASSHGAAAEAVGTTEAAAPTGTIVDVAAEAGSFT